MALHRLTRVTIGVPDPVAVGSYYTDFGLTPRGDGSFATEDGGEQLRLVKRPARMLVELAVGADDVDDLGRIAASLGRLGIPCDLTDGTLSTLEPSAGFTVRVHVVPRLAQRPVPPTPYNGPARTERIHRAPGVLRESPVKPKRLGHTVVGTANLEATVRFFVDGLGFKTSDLIGDKGAFLRCSSDHHNFLALAAPLNFLHHTSWQVDDIDEIGRGASSMLEGHPERHVWGLGRHHAGSNFFWYLKDPAGNFSEYFSDMDCIPEDDLWEPEVFHGKQGLFNWGPPPPPSFLEPDDLAGLMTGQHTP
jgi:catechol 2,3-dioxygenase-like lactoylglutathione lyase family enzyme